MQITSEAKVHKPKSIESKGVWISEMGIMGTEEAIK